MSPLEEATTSQLLLELKARFLGVVFCGVRADEESSGDEDPDDSEDGQELRFFYGGGLTMAYGLSERLKRFLDTEADISEGSLEDASDGPEEEEEA